MGRYRISYKYEDQHGATYFREEKFSGKTMWGAEDVLVAKLEAMPGDPYWEIYDIEELAQWDWVDVAFSCLGLISVLLIGFLLLVGVRA